MSVTRIQNIIASHKKSIALVIFVTLFSALALEFSIGFDRIFSSVNYVFNRIDSPLLETFDLSKSGTVLDKSFRIKKECSYSFDIHYVSGSLFADKLGQAIGSNTTNGELGHAPKLMRLIIEKKVGSKFIVEADKFFDAAGAATYTPSKQQQGGFSSGEFRRHLGALRLSEGDKRLKLYAYTASPKLIEVISTLEIPSQVAECQKIKGTNILAGANAALLSEEIKKHNATRSVDQVSLQETMSGPPATVVQLGMTMDEAMVAGGYAYLAVYEPSSESPVFRPIESIKSSDALRSYPKFDLFFFNQNQFDYSVPVLFRAQFVNDKAVSLDYVSR